jgi:glycine/D-amino acid oxidase-like deaminating enzyme
MTGALVAHAFASAGVATTLLEGGLAGRGSTAASSAMLLQEPDLELTQLTRRFGAKASRRIWQMSADSVEGLVRLLQRLRIPCDLKRSDAVYYAVKPEAASALRAEFDLRRRFGFDGTWLGPAAVRQATGLTAHGAIRSRGNAQFDPYRACLGVLRSAAAAGAKIFERSGVRRIVAGESGPRLITDHGTLDCDRVVIATGYATPYFKPLAGRFRMFRTYVVATKAATAAHRRDVGLSDVMVWDTERPYHYARWSGRRLLIGGGDRLLRPGPRQKQFAAATNELREHFERRWPALYGIETEAAWEGLFAMTPDTLPYIGPHRRYPNHWFALGYGGNGMTFGYLAAQLLVERWQGRVTKDHRLFEFTRRRRP